jgi:hypothetical protein
MGQLPLRVISARFGGNGDLNIGREGGRSSCEFCTNTNAMGTEG